MYLVKNIINFQGKSFPMVGVFNCSVVMANKLQALGYIEIEVRKDNILSRKGIKSGPIPFTGHILRIYQKIYGLPIK